MGHYRSEMTDPGEEYRPYYPTELPPLAEETLAWNIARAAKAEKELTEMRATLGRFRALLESCPSYL
jgi:hypothetical protein